MSLWQTKSWQEMLKKSGQTETYFKIPLSKGENCKAGGEVFIEKRKVSLGEYGLFIVGFDSIDCRGTKFCVSTDIQKALQNLCKQENCLFVQIETLDYSTGPSHTSANKGDLKNSYYKKFIPPYTALIDLNQTEEEILAGMKPKGRYNINLARKKGVSINIVEKSEKNIDIFFQLLQETTSRDSFSGNKKEYYKNFLQMIPHSSLLFATYDKKVIAGGIFVFENDVGIYYYGVSSNTERNLMAPYLLQWAAIQEAKKRGCTLYDFLGTAGPNDKNSPLEGVTDFKLKFSSDRRLVSESFLWVNKKWKFFTIQLLKKLKKDL